MEKKTWHRGKELRPHRHSEEPPLSFQRARMGELIYLVPIFTIRSPFQMMTVRCGSVSVSYGPSQDQDS